MKDTVQIWYCYELLDDSFKCGFGEHEFDSEEEMKEFVRKANS